MAIGLALALLALVIAFVAVYLLVRSRNDQRKAAIAKRLKELTAPTAAVTLAPAVEILSPDTLLRRMPDFLQPRLDKILGATGYEISLRNLFVSSVIAALVVIVGAGLVLHFSFLIVALAAVAAAVLVPIQVVNTLKSRHSAKFLERFPDAIDLIVRAVRAGLPVLGSIDAVGNEAPEPVGIEFRRILADTRIGVTLEQALARAAGRVSLVEFNFFVATIALQRESGGNLTETLATLSSVLRRRVELRAKTRALTAEARLSAMVLSAMPIFTGGVIALISPAYFSPLFSDAGGGYILGGAALNMALAIFTMRTMLRKSLA